MVLCIPKPLEDPLRVLDIFKVDYKELSCRVFICEELNSSVEYEVVVNNEYQPTEALWYFKYKYLTVLRRIE